MSRGDNSVKVVTAILVLLVALLAFQAAASATAPPGGIASTGRVIGQTGFAYIGGIRTFAAAVIWNRLQPLFHSYYKGQSLSQMTWALPAMNVVQILDPQFLQAYYEASYNVYRMGKKEDAFRIARQGVENNPQSGFMRANLVQLLLIDDAKANLPEMIEHADAGMGKDAYWSNTTDLYEGLAIFRAAYRLSEQTQKADAIQTRLDELREGGVGVGDHDHDGDGEQDH